MQSFDALFTLAAKRKGGTEALEALLPKPASVRSLSRIGDDRWFSAMTKCVFQAGFNWKVVEKKCVDQKNEGNLPYQQHFLPDDSWLINGTETLPHLSIWRTFAVSTM